MCLPGHSTRRRREDATLRQARPLEKVNGRRWTEEEGVSHLASFLITQRMLIRVLMKNYYSTQNCITNDIFSIIV